LFLLRRETIRNVLLNDYEPRAGGTFACASATWASNGCGDDDVSGGANNRSATKRGPDATVVVGGFVMALASRREFARGADAAAAATSAAPRCRWFTLFREPVARCVSALHYCRRNQRFDTAVCGGVHAAAGVDARTASVREWAEMWGNFALRQLLLAPDAAAAAGVAGAARDARMAYARAMADLRAATPRAGHGSRTTVGNTRSALAAPWMEHRRALGGADDPRRGGRRALDAVAARLAGADSAGGPRQLFDWAGTVEM
jgi:hypothetical protein